MPETVLLIHNRSADDFAAALSLNGNK